MSTGIPPPLIVDLDGTLVRTDTLWESLFILAKDRPLDLLGASLTLGAGRAAFKARVADLVEPDVAGIPLNTPLIDWLRDQAGTGRRLVLATATNGKIAQLIADRVGLFNEVLASDGQRNLKGPHKAAVLVERFARGGFDYVGDSRADLPVWSAARRAIVVGGTGLAKAAGRVAEVERVFAPPPRLPVLRRALRLHQWAKNVLVFLPLLAAHQVGDGHGLVAAALAFLAFGLTASAVYLLNDLLDLGADRRHPTKCRRPFAAGDLPLSWGLLLTPLLLLGATAISLLWLPPAFGVVLAGYFVLTSAYSLDFKRRPILDVMTLASLYTLRVIAGGAAVSIWPSFWLLALSLFVFLSLALVKRYAELDGLRERGELTSVGRGWHVDDLNLVGSLGAASGIAAVLVLALYIDSETARRLYRLPEALWLLTPIVLYWVSHIWFKTHRGEMHEDPVVFAFRDRVSLGLGFMAGCVVLLATQGINL
jgi:4-hydroxybenzoate polyprenyltransferase/phosphoserine phosphatase